jgi:hypothetical protein
MPLENRVWLIGVVSRKGSLMTEQISLHADEDSLSPGAAQSPLHGFRGQPDVPDPAGVPAALSIAISRETGSRGTAIAQRAGAKLGWQVYTQDLLEYISQQGTINADPLEGLSPAAERWVEQRLQQLHKAPGAASPNSLALARLVLALGAQGEVVLLGRGAGCFLPARSTLHVRLVAPLADRIAYISQWMRLSDEEAADYVARSDQRRAEFVQAQFQRQAGDVHQYDLVLNTSLLGEERSAELIVQAARIKAAVRA